MAVPPPRAGAYGASRRAEARNSKTAPRGHEAFGNRHDHGMRGPSDGAGQNLRPADPAPDTCDMPRRRPLGAFGWRSCDGIKPTRAVLPRVAGSGSRKCLIKGSRLGEATRWGCWIVGSVVHGVSVPFVVLRQDQDTFGVRKSADRTCPETNPGMGGRGTGAAPRPLFSFNRDHGSAGPRRM